MRHQDRIVALATRAHGVVTRQQLLAVGLSASAIARLVRAGWLIVVHPGVYRVGHVAPSTDAKYLAAVLACGDRALLSGCAAAWWLGVIRGDPPPPEVTAPKDRQIAGVRTHRSADVGRLARWR